MIYIRALFGGQEPAPGRYMRGAERVRRRDRRSKPGDAGAKGKGNCGPRFSEAGTGG